MPDSQASRSGCLLDEGSKRERRRQTRVISQTCGRLGEDEARCQQSVAGRPEPRVVITDPLVRAIAAPDQRDEGTRVDVDDSQDRTFGAP